MTGPLSGRKVERPRETNHTETQLSGQQSHRAHPGIFSPLISQCQQSHVTGNTETKSHPSTCDALEAGDMLWFG